MDPAEGADLIPLEEHGSKCMMKSTLRDGKKIDFVLVYSVNDKKCSTDESKKRREVFENHLKNEGLILELDESHSKLHFLKIHAPDEVLRRYCEIMKIKMPLKEIAGQEDIKDEFDIILNLIKSPFEKLFRFLTPKEEYFPEKKYELTAEFNRDRLYLFDVDNPNFFPESTRISIVYFILERQRFNDDHDAVYDIGIERLVNDGVYKAAYPLHDGDTCTTTSRRNILLNHWAQVSHWIKFQPVDDIKDYFGVKIALYFSWLGFYTHMLIPASIVGIICFFYGLVTLSGNTLCKDICNPNFNVTMCPLCDQKCDYWRLQESCLEARITYLFDNQFTVIFAVFMSFWSTLYLELWKRYSANITHRWGLTGFDHHAEHPRPQYLAKFAHCKLRKNVVTHILEPVVPFWRVRLPFTLFSYAMVMVLIAIVCGAVFGVVLYRMSQLTADSLVGGSANSAVLMPCSAALINLVLITFLNFTYDKLAVYLTEMEYLRTQTEYDDSLTLKIYLFQFVNYYSSIFYIAFLKGKFVGYPMKYNRVLGYRQEECSPGGCFLELFIQLATIMIGKQAISAIMEMLIPFLQSTIRSFLVKAGITESTDDELDENNENPNGNQWISDYKLLQWGPRGLFDEYLEMILQYGFVTLFVCAFPLAPLFALLNNILEMRLDAKKFLKFYQRPVPRRVKNIGIWYSIMDIIGRMSVISNAFMIAFSSNFIPRMVYMARVTQDGTDEGFLENSLAHFDVNDFQVGAAPRSTAFTNITTCRYSEYRNPPWGPNKYKRSELYWQIMMARLAFIVVFQNVVNSVRIVVEWAIPDVPLKLRDQIKREAYLTNEIIIRVETQKAKENFGYHDNVNLCYDHAIKNCANCQEKKDINKAMIESENEIFKSS